MAAAFSFHALRIYYSGDMKTFLLSSCLCVLAFPVFAQGDAITIIRDDGTKGVIPLGSGNGSAGSGVSAQDSVVMRKRPPAVEVEIAREPVMRAERVDDVVHGDVPALNIVSEPEVETKPEAQAEPASELRQEVVKPKAKPQVKAKVAAVSDVPKPARKPYRRPLEAPTGEPISKDEALNIALSEAPPSRDVQVNVIEDGQGRLYSVIFKTEDGGYEVLVDGVGGVILRSGKIENGQALVEPGHLPMR